MIIIIKIRHQSTSLAAGSSSVCLTLDILVLYPKRAGRTNLNHCHITHHGEFESAHIFQLRHMLSFIKTPSRPQQSQPAYEDDSSIYLAYHIRQRGLWRLQGCEAELFSATYQHCIVRTGPGTIQSSQGEHRMLP